MSIDITPRVMRDAIQSALKLRRSHTIKSRSLIQQYAGPDYREGWTAQGQDFYNHCFQWVVNIVPNHVLNNPTVRVTDMGIQDQETQILTWAMKSLIPQIKLSRHLRLIAYDQEFDFGVSHVKLAETGGLKVPSEYKPMKPVLERLSPRLYLRDHRTPELGAPRFEGHIMVSTVDDMLKALDENGNPKYDASAIKSLSDCAGLDEIRTELINDGLVVDEDCKNTVVYFEIYVPERKSLLCLAYDQGDGARELRKEREYSGPESGPYHLFGTYAVPDQVYPLPNLAVTKRQAEEINKHRAQMSIDAGTAKRLAICNSASEGVLAAVKDAPSGSVLSAPGFTGQIQTFEFGGPQPASVEYVANEKQELFELSGLTEMQRGNTTGATATESAEAAAFADVRIAFSKNLFTENTVAALNKLVALMDENKDVHFPFAIPTQAGLAKATYHGGPGKMTQNKGPWKRELTVAIEPYSMEYVNKDRLRNQMREAQAHVLSIMQASAQAPWINAKTMIDDMFETLNMPFSGDRYMDMQMWVGMMMNQLLVQQGAGAPTGGAVAESAEKSGQSRGTQVGVKGAA